MLLVYLNIRLIVRWIFSDYHLSYSYSTGHHGKGFFNSFSISPSWSFFWSLFSRIRNEYVGSLSKSPNSLGIRENDDLKRFSDVFKGYRKRPVAWDGLSPTVQSIALTQLLLTVTTQSKLNTYKTIRQLWINNLDALVEKVSLFTQNSRLFTRWKVS